MKRFLTLAMTAGPALMLTQSVVWGGPPGPTASDSNQNTAGGTGALGSIQNGKGNTAFGYQAEASDLNGQENTATGSEALSENTSDANTADGTDALFHNAGIENNIALGSGAGKSLTRGSNNIHIGSPGAAAESRTKRIGSQGTQNATSIAEIAGVPVTGTDVVINSSGRLGGRRRATSTTSATRAAPATSCCGCAR